MTKIKITQVKSGIDRPDRQKLTLKALGLNKLNASREVEASPAILGMVRKVNHLISIEEVQGSTESEVPQTNSGLTQAPTPLVPSSTEDEVPVFRSGE
jgi:large subunit ribosomal protein L30